MGAPEYTPPPPRPVVDYVSSQNLPPLSGYTPPLYWLCEVYSAPRFYPSLPEYTPPLFNNYMRQSQNIPIPPSQNTPPPFQQLYATLLESSPPSRIILPFSTTICDPPIIYPSSQNLPPFQQLYATLPESTPPSRIIPPFSTTICDPPIIYPFLPEYTPFSATMILCDPPRIYLHIYICWKGGG